MRFDGAPRRFSPIMAVPRRRGNLRGTGWGALRAPLALAAVVVAPQVGDFAPLGAALPAHGALVIALAGGQPPRARPGRHSGLLGHTSELYASTIEASTSWSRRVSPSGA